MDRPPGQKKWLFAERWPLVERYKSLYIPLPSSAKQQREMTKFCVVRET